MVKDASKQAVLLNYLRIDHWDTDNIWIGATDQQREGDWRWIDGSKISYSRFANGQGNNHNSGFLFANGGNEDCALIRRDDGGHWHDYPCQPIFGAIGYTYSYACEFPETPAPTTTMANVETPAPTTMPKAETPAPTTTMANVETPAPTTMPKAETPAPTTTMANVETPAPTTHLPNIETPAPTTAQPNKETPAATLPPPTAIIGRRRRR
ncbi:unnamed protein product [Mytilus edulis]|uniref:C-type lectin domain-containing protein n=1 Tax=Mytilus edulis TaxID=6550 RepID=A0A8S3SM63_MYTED|nr:unnamed protein product [Mytilus edulis]